MLINQSKCEVQVLPSTRHLGRCLAGTPTGSSAACGATLSQMDTYVSRGSCAHSTATPGELVERAGSALRSIGELRALHRVRACAAADLSPFLSLCNHHSCDTHTHHTHALIAQTTGCSRWR